MNNYITGVTIKTLREKLRLTQSQLAEKLCVSDKAVSKWETGKGFPDISLIEPLAAALRVSVPELLTGEQIINANRSANIMKSNIYVCPICGNILFSAGAALISCCGVTLPPEEAESADEAHQLEIKKVDDEYHISVSHPMTKAHYISFVAYCTDERFEMVKLYPEGSTEISFSAEDMVGFIGIAIITDCFVKRFVGGISMKVTVFNGSPSCENSATHVIAKAFLKGAASAGAQTENIFLAKYKIQQCQGCFSCWFKKPGECILRDDMRQLLQLYNESDIVCFATPIYTWNMTALLKNFVDRLAPLKCPKMTEKNGNYDLQDSKAKTQKFVVISNCGFPGDNNFEVLHASVACCNPSLEIYRNCGKLLKTKNPTAYEKVEQWLKAVEESGREMVVQGSISVDIAEALKMQLMSVNEYISFLGM